MTTTHRTYRVKDAERDEAVTRAKEAARRDGFRIVTTSMVTYVPDSPKPQAVGDWDVTLALRPRA